MVSKEHSLLWETSWIHSLATESRLHSKCSDIKFQEENETTVRIRTVREGSHEEVRCKESGKGDLDQQWKFQTEGLGP